MPEGVSLSFKLHKITVVQELLKLPDFNPPDYLFRTTWSRAKTNGPLADDRAALALTDQQVLFGFSQYGIADWSP